jgi:cytochrome P450
MVVAALIGIAQPERVTLASLARGLAAASSVEEARRIGGEYADFLLEQIRARRGRQENDLLTSVANFQFGDRKATDHELLKFAMLMVAAGHLTTTDACANTLLVLAQDEQLRRRVVADFSLIPALIEESVRHEPAVAATGRAVLVETALGGVSLSPGERVLLAWGSANRDERYFPDGDEFRLGRGRGRRPHLGWGAGAHRCLGVHVARLELRVMIEEALRAIPDFWVEDGVRPERTFGVIRGVRSLPVEWPVPQD